MSAQSHLPAFDHAAYSPLGVLITALAQMLKHEAPIECIERLTGYVEQTRDGGRVPRELRERAENPLDATTGTALDSA